MLFSEPKIPQCRTTNNPRSPGGGFQCSSASRKFLNLSVETTATGVIARFSALQRAENSSIAVVARRNEKPQRFQCSSASRKFLNSGTRFLRSNANQFQCSSASRKFLNQTETPSVGMRTRFQCSSASRKFLNRIEKRIRVEPDAVSVLFSEPKIPQSIATSIVASSRERFQCSSASRKFLNRRAAPAASP